MFQGELMQWHEIKPETQFLYFRFRMLQGELMQRHDAISLLSI